MWKNRYKKAVTFSYDDGVTQDIRLVELLGKYNLKATFNLNSALLGKPGMILREGQRISHYKVSPTDVRAIYDGHEVAAHTLTHPLLPSLSDDQIVREVEEDRLALSSLVGYEVVGMAYPCGGENNDARTASLIRERTGIRYARTIVSVDSFKRQTDLYRFDPNVAHIMEYDRLMTMGERFLASESEEDQILYVWGHAFEMDYDPTYWSKMEDFCRLIAGRANIFYGTNKEVLLSN